MKHITGRCPSEVPAIAHCSRQSVRRCVACPGEIFSRRSKWPVTQIDLLLLKEGVMFRDHPSLRWLHILLAIIFPLGMLALLLLSLRPGGGREIGMACPSAQVAQRVPEGLRPALYPDLTASLGKAVTTDTLQAKDSSRVQRLAILPTSGDYGFIPPLAIILDSIVNNGGGNTTCSTTNDSIACNLPSGSNDNGGFFFFESGFPVVGISFIPNITAQGWLKAAPNGPYDGKGKRHNCGADNSGRSEWHRRL
jgi:hypothetical protein